MKHFSGIWLVSLIVGVYTAFVAMCMWNWFVVPALGVSKISFFHMVGLVWLIKLLVEPTHSDGYKWQLLYRMLDFCMPSDERGNAALLVKQYKSQAWIEILDDGLNKVLVSTLVLVLGFGLSFLTGA